MKSSNKRKLYYQPLFLIVLFGLLVFSAKGTYATFNNSQKIKKELVVYKDELLELEKRRKKLTDDINRLESKRGREKEYRERFNVVKDGEKLIRVIEE